jgi:ligand-binding SRPBCC domain-containing protein
MKIYQFHQRQSLPISQEDAWRFFANPANLLRLMPPWMSMKPMGKTEESSLTEVYPGFIEVYRVTPRFLPPSTWVSVITAVEPLRRFTDEKKRGPFGFWHHTHDIRPRGEAGVEVYDQLYYGMPLGIFGQIAHALFVRRMIVTLFEYRQKALKRIFEPVNP